MEDKPIRITLTTFVKFALATTPGKRVAVVEEAKEYYEPGYTRLHDYWRPLRVAIVKMHENGSNPADLDAFLATVEDKRLANFKLAARAYKRWMGKKSFDWVGGPGATWTHGLLVVKVNPEVIARINGTLNVVKLHFGEEVSKRRVDTMIHLVETTLTTATNATVGILDVKRGRLFPKTREVPHIEKFLRSEAAAFIELWNLP